MKKIAFFLVGLVFCTTIQATVVNVDDAQQVATCFVQQQAGTMTPAPCRVPNRRTAIQPSLRRAAMAEEQPAYYVFNIGEDEGYVFVSADDCAHPILGYTDRGTYDENDLPDNLRTWLKGYEKQIRLAQEQGLQADSAVSAEWQTMRNSAARSLAAATVVVSPLLKSNWDQDAPFNNLCPYNSRYRERTPTGCVATAMAQVMYYWKYPKQGTGYHSYVEPTFGTLSASFGSTTYDWANMKNYYSSYTTAQANAVATLMYHCGVATEMTYDIADNGGSGTFIVPEYCQTGTDNAAYALKNYFGYKYTKSGIRDYTISTTTWKKYLKDDLNNNRPVIYAGFGDGGHCFVCDGYKSDETFHFNFGWSGAGDGYYLLNAVDPLAEYGIGAGGYSYNEDQMAIFGLEPKEKVDPQQEETFDLRMYSPIKVTSKNSKYFKTDTIYFYDDLWMSGDIANYGDGDFTGTIAAVLLDHNGALVDFIDSVQGTLGSMTYFTLNDTCYGGASLCPGVYYVSYFYRTKNQGWTAVGDGDYSNLKRVVVYYADGIEVYSDMTENGDLQQHSEAQFVVNIANINDTTFHGSLRLVLANLSDGDNAQVIEVLKNQTISSGTFIVDTFRTQAITVNPGTYLLEVNYQPNGSNSWYYAGSYFYSNPVRVVVKAPELLPDKYERNNSQDSAYAMSVKFSKVTLKIDANIHVGTDIDYYKFDVPQGYHYTITPTYLDAQSSAEQTLRGSAAYFTSTDPTHISLSEANTVGADGGETIFFRVCPMMSGGKGTYHLEFEVQRSKATDIEDTEDNAGEDKVRYIDLNGRTISGDNDAKNVKVIYYK